MIHSLLVKKFLILQNLEALFTKHHVHTHHNKIEFQNEKNHHLLEMTRTLLFQNNVPKNFGRKPSLPPPT
jgi:hypothetical protein